MDSEETKPADDVSEQYVSPEAVLYCPLCSKRLVEMKCKLVCERCGYFMSCADYY